MQSLHIGLFLIQILTIFPHSTAFPSLEDCTFLDLTHSFSEKTIYWPGEKSFKLTTTFDGMTDEGYYYLSNNIEMSEHGGTHLDAPVHFAQGKFSIDKMPLSNLIGEACVVDVTDRTDNNKDYQIDIDDVIEWEKNQDRSVDRCILLFLTGWARFWPTRDTYMGTSTTTTSELHFPGIHPNTAKWLVDQRNVKAVGIDTASLDFGQSTLFETHRILLKQNIPGMENLCNLDRLPPSGTTLIALPIKVKNGSGGPLRAVVFGMDSARDSCRRSSSNIVDVHYYIWMIFLFLSTSFCLQ